MQQLWHAPEDVRLQRRPQRRPRPRPVVAYTNARDERGRQYMHMARARAGGRSVRERMCPLCRLRSVVNRPQTDLRPVRLREVDEPRSPGICARASICSVAILEHNLALGRYTRSGGCSNAGAGNGASEGKNRLTAVQTIIGRRYFHTSWRCRSQGKVCSHPESTVVGRRASGAHWQSSADTTSRPGNIVSMDGPSGRCAARRPPHAT